MRLFDHYLHCVVFLGSEEDGGDKYGGSAFFVQLEHTDERGTARPRYLVTARHNLKHPRKVGQGLRFAKAPFAEYTNLVGHTFRDSLVNAVWLEPEDETVDLAVCYFPGMTHNLSIPPDRFVNATQFGEHGIGVGDETYSVSLFGFKGTPVAKEPIVRVR